jgi:hypothetical protein
MLFVIVCVAESLLPLLHHAQTRHTQRASLCTSARERSCGDQDGDRQLVTNSVKQYFMVDAIRRGHGMRAASVQDPSLGWIQ